jgi:hypothetical protein
VSTTMGRQWNIDVLMALLYRASVPKDIDVIIIQLVICILLSVVGIFVVSWSIVLPVRRL